MVSKRQATLTVYDSNAIRRVAMKCLAVIILLTTSTVTLANDTFVPNRLVQQILNHSSLSNYWHTDLPNRTPLRMLQKHINPNHNLQVAGKKISLISQPSADVYFEIASFTKTNDIWIVNVNYPIEGVSGIFKAKLSTHSTWMITSTKLWEE